MWWYITSPFRLSSLRILSWPRKVMRLETSPDCLSEDRWAQQFIVGANIHVGVSLCNVTLFTFIYFFTWSTGRWADWSPPKHSRAPCTKIKSQTKLRPWDCTPTPRQQCLPSINFLHLTICDIWTRQDFRSQGHCSKVKLRSDHGVTYLHAATNVCTKYELPPR